MEPYSINLGDRFPSYSIFLEKLEAFQLETNTQFITKVGECLSETDCFFERFRYCVLRLHCKQGKKSYVSKASGQRPNQRSYKVNCPVQMNVRLNRPKGQDPFLKVTKLEMNHKNHQVSEELFQLYPEQRRICTDDDVAVQIILSSNSLKTCEQREILEEMQGVAVMSQDVYNMKRKLANESGWPGKDKVKDVCQEVAEEIVAEGSKMTKSKGRLLSQYPVSNLVKAYEAAKSKEMSLTKASSTFGVPKSSLHDVLSGRSRLEGRRRSFLSTEDEAKLAAWLRNCASAGCGKTRQELFLEVKRMLEVKKEKGDNVTSVFKDNMPGRSWFRTFMARHPDLSENDEHDIVPSNEHSELPSKLEVCENTESLSFNSSDALVEVPSSCSEPFSPSNQLHSSWESTDVAFNVSKLIEHVIETGWTSADFWHIQRCQFINRMPKPEETDYATYLELWNAVVPPSNSDDFVIPQKQRKVEENQP